VIDDIDVALVSWARSIAGDADVRLGLPQADPGALTVWLYLYGFADRPATRGPERAPHQAQANYLVIVGAPEPDAVHRTLGALLQGALDHEEWEVEWEPWSASDWQSAKLPRQPAFGISALVRMPRPEVVAKPVLHPLEVRGVALEDFEGVVVGPGDVPLVDVRIELAGKSTRTDRDGRFRFCAMPETSPRCELHVSTKGREFSVIAERAGSNQPVIIRLDPPGGD
jgi:hypothetical protein